MNQYQLDRALARATGESVRTIRSRGFSHVILPKSKTPQENRFPVSRTQAGSVPCR